MITIILLLLLAAISISSLRNSGLFKSAKDAKELTEIAQEVEELKLVATTLKTQKLVKGESWFNIDELMEELNNKQKHPNIESVKGIYERPNSSIELSKKMDFKNLFIPNSYAATGVYAYAEVTYKSGRIYYVGVEDESGKIFQKENYTLKTVMTGGEGTEGEIGKEIYCLKQAISNVKAELRANEEEEVITIDGIRTELLDKEKYPNIEFVVSGPEPFESIREVAKNKLNIQNIFVPVVSAAMSSGYDDELNSYLSVTFNSDREYYICCKKGENNGKIYEAIENRNNTPFSMIETSELIQQGQQQLEYYESLGDKITEEEKGYKEQTINILETIKNNNCKDGYAIMGLSKKGLKKLGSGELNELNIPETYQGKNIEIIMQACAYNGETGVPYNNIKKVNIPDSVKIIFENAFSDYSPETEFNYNKEGKYAPDEAFPQ